LDFKEKPEEFSLNNASGSVSVAKALDRESLDFYNLTVVATNDCNNEPTSLDGIGLQSRLSLKIVVRME
jgi:hypothetical protein